MSGRPVRGSSDALLEEREAEAHEHAARDLRGGGPRVHHPADVVRGGVVDDAHLARPGVHLDLGGVGAERLDHRSARVRVALAVADERELLEVRDQLREGTGAPLALPAPDLRRRGARRSVARRARALRPRREELLARVAAAAMRTAGPIEARVIEPAESGAYRPARCRRAAT